MINERTKYYQKSDKVRHERNGIKFIYDENLLQGLGYSEDEKQMIFYKLTTTKHWKKTRLRKFRRIH